MIYLDTSVALAQILGEDRKPAVELWEDQLVSSRLLEYEVWNRLHRLGLAATHAETARDVLDRVAWVELTPEALSRALEPFPEPVRTLDALHLASAHSLRQRRVAIEFATYDDRLARAARALHLPLAAV